MDKTLRVHWYKRFEDPNTQFTWFNKPMTFESLLMDNLQAMKIVFAENEKWRNMMLGDMRETGRDFDEDNIVSAEADQKRSTQVKTSCGRTASERHGNEKKQKPNSSNKHPASQDSTDDNTKRVKPQSVDPSQGSKQGKLRLHRAPSTTLKAPYKEKLVTGKYKKYQENTLDNLR